MSPYFFPSSLTLQTMRSIEVREPWMICRVSNIQVVLNPVDIVWYQTPSTSPDGKMPPSYVYFGEELLVAFARGGSPRYHVTAPSNIIRKVRWAPLRTKSVKKCSCDDQTWWYQCRAAHLRRA